MENVKIKKEEMITLRELVLRQSDQLEMDLRDSISVDENEVRSIKTQTKEWKEMYQEYLEVNNVWNVLEHGYILEDSIIEEFEGLDKKQGEIK